MEEHYLNPTMEIFKSSERVRAFQFLVDREILIKLVDDHGKPHTFEIKPGDWLVRDETGYYFAISHDEFKSKYEPLDSNPLLSQRKIYGFRLC